MDRFHRLVPLLLFLLFLAVPAWSQTGVQLTGRVVAEGGAPIAGAAVTAQSAADTTQVVSALTQQDGNFRLTLIPGAHRLRVTHLGYQAHARDITVSQAAATQNLGSIELSLAPVAIEGVEVEGERSAVVFTPDRTIYHTRDMPAVQGGVATDALRSVPELDVDLEGQVKLRGATPQIHINGRPTPMQGEALQQFLQQLPSDRIERVEVMPNPSARYEADGAGGIVNIVLKRNEGLGLSGSLGLTAGTRGTSGGFGNLAYQEGKVTVFGSGSLNFSENENDSFDLRQNLLADPVTFLQQEGRFGSNGMFSRGDMTLEYQLTEKTALWSSLAGGGYGSDSDGTTAYTLMDALRAPTERYDRITTSNWARNNLDASVGLRHVFEQGKHELSVEGRRSNNGGGNDGRFVKQLFDLEGSPLDIPPELTTDDRDEDETRTWMKADYERPLGETRLQIGYQANLQSTGNHQVRETFTSESGTVPVLSHSNGFDYDENFHQGYVTLSRSLGKLSVQLGLRGELANTELGVPGTEETYSNEYANVFPSANLGYDLGGGRRLGLNYSKRIQRPWVFYLNPVDFSTDPLTRRIGNPELEPQYTHSIGADLSWTGEKGTLRMAPYYRSTVNSWGQITRADAEGVLTTTWENVASTRSYGSMLSVMMRSTGALSGNVGAGLYREERDASNLSSDYSGEYFRYNANGNLMVALTSNLNLQGMLWYNSPQELPQGRRSAFVMSSVGARMQIFNRKATLNLNIQDPFELARYDFQMRDRSVTQSTRNDYSMRSAQLSISYNFGRRPQSVRRPTGQESQPQPVADPAAPPMQ